MIKNNIIVQNHETTTILVENSNATTNWTIDNVNNRTQEITSSEIALSTLCALSIVVNLCVITVLLIGPRAFRLPTFYFIANTACSNLLCDVAVLTNIHIPVQNEWKEQAIVIKGFMIVGFSVSVTSFVYSACDRLSKICCKGKYHKVFTDRSSIAVIIISWLVVLGAFLLAPLLGWTCIDFCSCPPNDFCECDLETCSQSLIPFSKSYVIVTLIYFNFSFLVIFVMFFRIYLDVRKVFGTNSKLCGKTLGQVPIYGPFIMVHLKRDVHLAKTLFLVVITFMICAIPIMVLFAADAIGKESELDYWFTYSLIPVIAHSLVSSLIYSLRLPRMWSTFKHLAFATWRRMHKWKCKNSSETKFVSKRTQQRENAAQDESNTSAISNECCLASVPRNKSFYLAPTPSEMSVAETDCVVLSEDSCNTSFRCDSSDGLQVETVAHATHMKEGRNKSKHFKSFNRKPQSTSQKILLSNGTLISRDLVQISSPLNTEIKLTW